MRHPTDVSNTITDILDVFVNFSFESRLILNFLIW